MLLVPRVDIYLYIPMVAEEGMQQACIYLLLKYICSAPFRNLRLL